MDLNQLHFAHPEWFWALLIIPFIWFLFFRFDFQRRPHHQLEKFIDKHLIPFLLVHVEKNKKRKWLPLICWTLVWSCLVFSLAGPRWNYREATTFTRDQSLVILLDLSESMNAQDISPSRLGRAKQKIEDLLNLSKGIKIGMIAFAADPHMIVPMTDDKETIRHLLPSIDTDLVYIQGSKLTPALEMAKTMLQNEPGNNKALVIISDGGFEDVSAIHTVKKLAAEGIVFYSMGVGSMDGAPLKDRQGTVVKKNGTPIITKLEKEKFREISKIGNGRYFDADHTDQMGRILEDLEKRSDVQQATHHTQRYWEEHFYLFLFPVIPFFLWWYRQGFLFALLCFSFIPFSSEASVKDYFYTTDQQAQQAFEKEDYVQASEAFQDPYRKGVALYRQGEYASAEEMFRQSDRPEVSCSANYNLGNALVQQNKFEEAITAYEKVLEKWPEHTHAQENLEIVKKMLEHQQKQEQSQNSDKEQSNNKSKESNQQKDQNSSKNNDEKKSSSSSDKQNQKQKEDEKDQNNKDQQKDSSQERKDDSSQQEQSPSSTSKDNENEANSSEKEADSAKKTNRDDQETSEPEEKSCAEADQACTQQPRSQEDLDADLWLNQIKNDPKALLKKKFYLESKKNGTKEEIDPW